MTKNITETLMEGGKNKDLMQIPLNAREVHHYQEFVMVRFGQFLLEKPILLKKYLQLKKLEEKIALGYKNQKSQARQKRKEKQNFYLMDVFFIDIFTASINGLL